MAKHVGSLDVRKDLRVRGRVEDNLRVRNEVEASAFYVRGVGELISGVSGFNGQPIFKTNTSSNDEGTIEGALVAPVQIPAAGEYYTRITAVIHTTNSAQSGAGSLTVMLREKIGLGAATDFESRVLTFTPLQTDGYSHAHQMVFFSTEVPKTNGETYQYDFNLTIAGTWSYAAGGGTSLHSITVEAVQSS